MDAMWTLAKLGKKATLGNLSFTRTIREFDSRSASFGSGDYRVNFGRGWDKVHRHVIIACFAPIIEH